ncbi:TetR/AcrR family transcriptional regulator [Gordonia sp. CPCC 205515]|uniref:TetR/AcrR family transcriptional regulator n=1 Tax=Gordonia sp. CPCC 205515 TaxID=3140791 RepID=UPI003AF354D1
MSGRSPNSGRRRKPTKSGVVLTHELIVDTAIRLLRLHGSEGLSARRLGLALGADASALYRYFPSVDDLRLAIADRLIDRTMGDLRVTGDWKANLRAFGLQVHAAYVADPHVAVLAASRVTGRPHETAIVERIIGVLRAAGFSDALATKLYRAMVDQMLAFAALDGAEMALPPEAREADLEKWASVYAQLPEAEYPNISAVSAQLVAIGERSAYPVALELMLDGAEVLLERSRSAGSGQSSSTPGTPQP